MIYKISENTNFRTDKATRGNRNTLVVDGNKLKKDDILEFKCKSCGKKTQLKFRFKQRFLELNFICTNCSIKKTNNEKYGVDNPWQSKEIRDKIKQTKLKKYGDENYHNVDKMKKTQINKYGKLGFNTNKQKETIEKKYGSEEIFQTQHFKNKSKNTKFEKYDDKNYRNSQKAKETNLKKYGSEEIFQTNYFKEKYKKTNLEKYGTEYPVQNEEIQTKIKNTNIEKYGTKYPIQNKEIYNKKKQTMLKKYNVEYPLQNEKIKQNKTNQFKALWRRIFFKCK